LFVIVIMRMTMIVVLAVVMSCLLPQYGHGDDRCLDDCA